MDKVFLLPYRIVVAIALCLSLFWLSGCSSSLSFDTPPAIITSEVKIEDAPRQNPPVPAKIVEKSTVSDVKNAAIPIITPAAGKAFDNPDQPMFCNSIAAANGKGGFLDRHSFIMSWYLIGPFKFASGNGVEQSQAIHHEFIANEKVPSRNLYPWTFAGGMNGKVIGEIDISRTLGKPAPHSVVYALTLLYAPKEMSNLTLLTGSDDFIKVWVNGKLVHTYNMTGREGKIDQDKVEAMKLVKGYNLLVVKVVNLDARWNFFFRFAGTDGAPIEFQQQTISANELDSFCRKIEKDLSL